MMRAPVGGAHEEQFGQGGRDTQPKREKPE